MSDLACRLGFEGELVRRTSAAVVRGMKGEGGDERRADIRSYTKKHISLCFAIAVQSWKSDLDPDRNPFASGAGCKPPEPDGRDAILESAKFACGRTLQGRSARSMLLFRLGS